MQRILCHVLLMVLEQGGIMQHIEGGELINGEGTVGPCQKENQQYKIELYTSELPSGEREHSLIRKDKAGKSAGCRACL